jgi:hypothetical protein
MKSELHNYIIDIHNKDGAVLKGTKRYGKDHAERICKRKHLLNWKPVKVT